MAVSTAFELLRDVSFSDDEDVFVTYHPVSWVEFEAFLERRGDVAGPRIAYWQGTLQLISPSRSHEAYKKCIARLLETYALALGLPLNGYGALTMKQEEKKGGLEPDECYVLGELVDDRPDLAIEVVWTRGAIRKLPIYQALGVRELWIWEKGVITIHELSDDDYVAVETSRFLPELDLEHLVSFIDIEDQTGAARRYFDTISRNRTR